MEDITKKSREVYANTVGLSNFDPKSKKFLDYEEHGNPWGMVGIRTSVSNSSGGLEVLHTSTYTKGRKRKRHN